MKFSDIPKKFWWPSHDSSPNFSSSFDVQLKVTLWLCQNSYWKWPFIVFPLKMVIFHSYVSLPEGRSSSSFPQREYVWILIPVCLWVLWSSHTTITGFLLHISFFWRSGHSVRSHRWCLSPQNVIFVYFRNLKKMAHWTISPFHSLVENPYGLPSGKLT